MLKRVRVTTNDQELLAGLRVGDPSAVRKWYGLYEGKLLRWLLYKVTNQADAEELSQEVFMNCLRNLTMYRADASLWSWMLGIARHEVSDFYRKKYAKKAIQALPLSEMVPAAEMADAHEVSEKVKQVFHRLSAETQELLMLKYVDGKSVKTIATELGKTVKAVESDLFRARQNFRSEFAAIDS